MVTQDDRIRLTLLQGTLDLPILLTVRIGRQHGQGIARAIQENSEDVLLVEHGALYPALRRLEAKRWITAEWGTSSNNRRARFYTLTKEGRKQKDRRAERMFWRRKRSQSDFSSEVKSHIALETDRLVAAGLSEEEAAAGRSRG